MNSHEHVVAPTPLCDRALVIAGARPDQGLDQPIPLRGAPDPTIQDLIKLGAAETQSAGQGRPVQAGTLLHPPQPGTELRNRALASFPCHSTYPGVRCRPTPDVTDL